MISLLAWARAEWVGSAPAGLNALAKQMADPALAKLLRDLDRACYAGGQWQGSALAESLPQLPPPLRPASHRPRALAPLYP